MNEKSLKRFRLCIILIILAGVFLLFAKQYYNPFPKNGLLFQVLGMDASELDSIGIRGASPYSEMKVVATKEELEIVFHMLNQTISFTEKYKIPSAQEGRGPDWRFYLFYQGKYYLSIGVEENAVYLEHNNMMYVYQTEIDLTAIETLPATPRSLFWASKKEYTPTTVVQARKNNK